MPVVYPTGAPTPVAVLGWDGTDFRVILVDAGHRQIVRGENQLFSIEKVVSEQITEVVSGADGFVASSVVPPGCYWVITSLCGRLTARATTEHYSLVVHDGVSTYLHGETRAIAAGERLYWSGHAYLDAGDTIRWTFVGANVGDTGRLGVTGYQFTIEV